MVKTRGVKILIVVLLSIFSIASFSLAATGIIYEINQKQTKPDAATYNLGNGIISTQDDYDKYETYTIGSLDGLYNFRDSIRNDFDFSGKNITLTNDINCNGSEIYIGEESSQYNDSFGGIFNGNGYTISNVSIDNSELLESKKGFFLHVRSGAIIKNTKFKDFYYYIPTTTQEEPTYTGIVAYQNYGTIQNCIVTNCKFISDRYKTNCNVAAVAGENYGTVENCLVDGSYSIGGKGKNIGNDDGLMSYYFVAKGNQAINSIFIASVNIVKNDKNDGKYVDAPDVNDSMGGSNYSSAADAYDSMSSNIASKTGGDSGTSWYKYSVNTRGFNNSKTYCVYLRSFISWTTYTFAVTPNASGYITIGGVTKSQLIVPSNYDLVIESGNKLTIDLQDVKAEANEGYEFEKWTKSGNTYTANFIVASVKLSFQEYDIEEQNSDDVYSLVVPGEGYEYRSDRDPYVFKVSKDTEISITFAKGNLTKDGCYTNCTIAFKNIDGVSCRVGFQMLYSDNNDGSSLADRYYIE